MNELENFYGPNAGYVLELYERYRRNPESMDADTRAIFDRWSPDGKRIASGSFDRTVQVWQAPPIVEMIIEAARRIQQEAEPEA